MMTATRLIELLQDAIRMHGGYDVEVKVELPNGKEQPMAGLLCRHKPQEVVIMLKNPNE